MALSPKPWPAIAPPGTAAGSAGAEAGAPQPHDARAQELASLPRLLLWLSPAFPVGGYSYSHGLEWVVETGAIADAVSLGDWIEDVLNHGAGRSDAIFLAHAWRALAAQNGAELIEIAELAAAFAISAERRLETLAQGTAFLAAVEAVWPHPALADLKGSKEVAYPVAVGACAAAHGLALAASAQAFTQAFAAALVSAGVRLIPLGQTDGLRVLARLEPLLAKVVAQALATPLAAVGSASILLDIASMRHETQYTRLFRS